MSARNSGSATEHSAPARIGIAVPRLSGPQFGYKLTIAMKSDKPAQNLNTVVHLLSPRDLKWKISISWF